MRDALLAAVLVCAPLAAAVAQDGPPPFDPAAAARVRAMADPANSPVTGASIAGGVTSVRRPPSLEALMAVRPGMTAESRIPEARAALLRDAGRSFGAAGGLAARGYALNEMLRLHEPQLDRVFDFRRVMVPLGDGSTLLLPPVVSEAQKAMVLAEGGQRARTTSQIFRITRTAEIAGEPPTWRSYLVPEWPDPQPPNDSGLPKNRDERAFWEQVVAEGWAMGEAQAVDVFLAGLHKLEADLVGMARYKTLLAARLVEQPKVSMQFRRAENTRDVLRLGDRDIEIRSQGGFNAPASGRRVP